MDENLINLLKWVEEYGIESEIRNRLADGLDEAVNYLMETAFDFDEAEKICEHFSL